MKIKVIALILIAALLLSACGTAATVTETNMQEAPLASTNERPDLAESQEEQADEADAQANNHDISDLPTEENANLPEAETDAIIDDFGAKLVDILSKNANGNVIISDLSINMALSLVLEGAEGEAKEALEKYLGYKKEESADINHELMQLLSRDDIDMLKIAVANSAWFDDETEVNQDYLLTIIDKYGAEAQVADFQDAKTADIINKWCDEHTNGLIPKVVDAGMIQDMAAVLVNALYFKGQWADEFHPSEDGLFNGEPAQMMRGEAETYMENDQATAFAKRYYGGYRFVGILPKDEGEFTMQSLDIASLLDTETGEYDVQVTMPKFKSSFESMLIDALSELGLKEIFQLDADLSGIGKGLYVSDVVHKTQFNLDEYGTEAAAVTAVIVANKAMPMQQELKEIVLDRPFAFVILGNDNHALFTGKVTTISE